MESDTVWKYAAKEMTVARVNKNTTLWALSALLSFDVICEVWGRGARPVDMLPATPLLLPL